LAVGTGMPACFSKSAARTVGVEKIQSSAATAYWERVASWTAGLRFSYRPRIWLALYWFWTAWT
jgi:hypothetical protein